MSDVDRNDTAWVIEAGSSPKNRPAYFAGLIHGDRLGFSWTEDPFEAVRFPRHCDAAAITANLYGHRIQKHIWKEAGP